MADPQPSPPKPLDQVILRNLHTHACVGWDAWGRKGKQQPVILTLSLGLDTEAAAKGDDVAETVSYGDICRDVIAGIEGALFDTLTDMVARILGLAYGWKGGKKLEVKVLLPKALLRVDGGSEYTMGFLREGEDWNSDGRGWRWRVEGLRGACVVGVNDHERREKQEVLVSFGAKGAESKIQTKTYPREIVRVVCEVIESSTFQTLEALAALIAETFLRESELPNVVVKVEKPSALAAVEGAGVEIERDREWMLRRTNQE